MAKSKVRYICRECGHTTAKWMGSCPSCGRWHTFREDVIEKKSKQKKQHKSQLEGKGKGQDAAPRSLDNISFEDQDRIVTRLSELDRVLGGGFMPGSFVMLGGDPGVGKSTLTLQIAKSNESLSILYCAGEESAAQIKQRARRLNIDGSQLLVYNETNLSKIVRQARKIDPDLLIIDSIQTVYRDELQSMPGSIQQLRECSSLLQQLAKQDNITTLIIGHVTKEGELAGPRLLEHTVDTVLHFESRDTNSYRLLRSLKNRFGPANEVGVFEMSTRGLREISNPSEFFITHREEEVSGSSIVCTIEGSRPLLVEVQALVTNSNYGTSQRTSTGFDNKRLSLILAVLEKRCGYQFSGQDVYLNVAGGLRLIDPATDLGVAVALVSSLLEKRIQSQMVFLGEIGLGAEIRAVSNVEPRLKEIEKLGYTDVVIPHLNNRLEQNQDLSLRHVSNLDEAFDLTL